MGRLEEIQGLNAYFLYVGNGEEHTKILTHGMRDNSCVFVLLLKSSSVSRRNISNFVAVRPDVDRMLLQLLFS